MCVSYPVKAYWLLHLPPALTLRYPAICAFDTYMCALCPSEHTVLIFINSIKGLPSEMACMYYDVDIGV